MSNKILLVGGTFSQKQNQDGTYGKPSGLVNKMATAIQEIPLFTSKPSDTLDVINGGQYETLINILNKTKDYNIVFWLANIVDNNLPKIRNVKQINPHCMLITSKRNDNHKYSYMELIQRALGSKSNLLLEFSKTGNKFQTTVLDPLGNCWYQGYDINAAIAATMTRIYFLASMLRQSSVPFQEDENKQIMAYYDEIIQTVSASTDQAEINDIKTFIQLVRQYADTFHNIMNPGEHTQRFIGNCSMRPPIIHTRCMNGFPSFKAGGYIFVSKRNVDKQNLDITNFVPVSLNNDTLYYGGEHKPSVDTPVQLRLYKALPHINYMIHSHCYIDDKDAVFTETALPCGAIHEYAEILYTIDTKHCNRELPVYKLNLIGHGSLLMSKSVKDLQNIKFNRRPMPEMFPKS